MKKLLIVIDMQNDFIDGALGTAEAEAIVPAVKAKIESFPPEAVIATMDTHGPDYLSTQEGRKLPVEHCIRGTEGCSFLRRWRRGFPLPAFLKSPALGASDWPRSCKRNRSWRRSSSWAFARISASSPTRCC